jgi:predicted ATP-grasp superfamily ATP-dependent carboligase
LARNQCLHTRAVATLLLAPRERPNPVAPPMTDRPAIIIVGHSARALASSAKRAGFAPLSIDVFGDDDTRELSLADIKLEGGLSDGLTLDKVTDAVKTLTHTHSPIGLVYGSGFEHQPETIGAVARMTRIFGNEAETLKRVKDPHALAQLCDRIGISHPPILFAPPDEPEYWLVKRRGGAGGAHISAATAGRMAPADCYFQRRISGQNISALFVANGKTAGIIGLSVQWTAPTPTSPFRYGGSAGPIDVSAALAEEIACAVASFTSELCLVGLNSADFVVSADAVWLLEINPRPGATLDVFEPDDGSLLALHVAGCEGRLMPFPTGLAFKAAEIVYAPCDIVSSVEQNWPDWTVDRPSPGTRIAAGDPLCTTLASGATVDLARACARGRAQEIIAVAQESNQ